jgi:hypothetical protein
MICAKFSGNWRDEAGTMGEQIKSVWCDSSYLVFGKISVRVIGRETGWKLLGYKIKGRL